MKTHNLLLLLVITLNYGCASNYQVNFDSDPRGASVVCNGKNWGETPVTLEWNESVENRKSFYIGNCSANWVSGANMDYISRLKVFPSGGTTISVDRPRGDGYVIDAQYALQLRQTKAAESAAATAKSAAREAKKQNNKTTTCFTNFGVTTCY